MAKERVDKLLVDRGLAPTREHAQRLAAAHGGAATTLGAAAPRQPRANALFARVGD